MTDSGDFASMSDPDFLAERTRVREELQELTERFRMLNEEFDRRARAAWRPTGEKARVLGPPERSSRRATARPALPRPHRPRAHTHQPT
jgi:hypothetical protein